MRNYKLPLETINYALRAEISKFVNKNNVGLLTLDKESLTKTVIELLSPKKFDVNLFGEIDVKKIRVIEGRDVVVKELGLVTLNGVFNDEFDTDFRVHVLLGETDKKELVLDARLM